MTAEVAPIDPARTALLLMDLQPAIVGPLRDVEEPLDLLDRLVPRSLAGAG